MMLAHDAVSRSELWSSWHPEPAVLVGLALAAWLYGRGLARLDARRRGRGGGRHTDPEQRSLVDGRPTVDRGSPADQHRLADRHSGAEQRPAAGHWPLPVRRVHVAAFAAALLVLAAALTSPLETAASSLFTAHMVQHLLLIVVAAPLLVVGRPGLVATAGLPAPPRRLLRRTRARPRVRRALDVAWHPVAVWGIGAGVLWAWHLPGPYEAAVTHDAVHALEHVTLVAVAALLWAAVLGRGRRSLTVPVAAVLLFASSLQSTALGAVLAFAQAPLYAIHEPIAPQWGLTPLQDQQIAGGLMWVPPGIVYMAVIATLLARWFTNLGAAAPGPGVEGDATGRPVVDAIPNGKSTVDVPARHEPAANTIAEGEPTVDGADEVQAGTKVVAEGGRVVDTIARRPS